MADTNIDAAQPALEECLGCRVQPGEYHDDGCDHAHCPGCGEQLLLHDCGDSDRPSIWRGIDPDEAAAVRGNLFYWHPAPDIQRWVPDGTRARALYEWDPTEQKFLVEG